MRMRYIKISITLMIALFAYALLFPASMKHNLAYGSFEVSFLLRAVDALLVVMPDIANNQTIIDFTSKHPQFFETGTKSFGGLSGIVSLIKILPLMIIGSLLILPFIMKTFRICDSISSDRAHIAYLMVFVLGIIPLATPLFNSPFYAFCVGIALMPLTLGISETIINRLKYAMEWRVRKKKHFKYI